MRLTDTQKACLTRAQTDFIRICHEDGVPGAVPEFGIYGARTVRRLIAGKFLKPTEYYNQYEITEAGKKKVSRFRKVWRDPVWK
ncbi:hypothetical protein [Emcibacter nanhaiensis]|uniref:Uncharacterized protein n=1 Tax=Emcibacter nanhaiensis TaxID=1505037 RepID=A0A501PS91_9PROT|nr:hypothetical protein [Emcibacter nanhaiensis]TPD63008.1 hypothetical protein FIV46_02710 [Emcibacter nanhaiensis]